MTTATKDTQISTGEYPTGVRVAQMLEERIRDGRYAPGSWLPTERTLSEEFRVDRSGIRAALVELEKDGLISRQPGCRPRVVKPGSSFGRETGRSGARRVQRETIAVIVPHHPVYPSGHMALLKGVHEGLRQTEAPYRLQVVDSHDARGNVAAQRELQAVAEILNDGVKGVILWPVGGIEAIAEVRQLRAAGCAVVYVDRCPEGEVCDFVGVNNRLAARTATEYLLRLGHTRIAHLTNTDPVRPVAERAEGYRDALTRAGITPDPALTATVQAVVHLNVSSAIEQFRGLADPPTAVFAMNDSLAHQFIVEAEERGWRIPEDVSVIGFDDMERFSPRPALLTTMHQPFEEIGQTATELLLQRLRTGTAGPAGQHLLLPVTIVERTTCRKVN